MKYNAQQNWAGAYAEHGMAFPSEYVIRIFRGCYPRLALDKDGYKESTILDISCGDGRDLLLFSQLGFKGVYGTEIEESIVERIRSNVADVGVPKENVAPGFNHALPFENAFFDYVMAWNVCYYMQNHMFVEYVNEYARVVKPGGILVFSIPKKTAFIYKDAELIDGGEYCIIKDDFFGGMRNGERMRIFEDEADIVAAFTPHFVDFEFGSIHDDCFGLAYHWHIGICRRTQIEGESNE